jgi:VanZ family protein
LKIDNWWKYHFPFFLWLAVIFVQSSFPAPELPEIEIISFDKIAHMAVYGLLAALCYISLIHQEKFNILREYPLLFTVLLCAAYGASDEFHQYFVPNRDMEFFDWLADALGVVVMVLVIKFHLSRRFPLFAVRNGASRRNTISRYKH